MSEIRIATRYAKSLVELAQEKSVLDKVHDDMQMFREVVNENRGLGLALKNPVIKSEKKREILNAIFTKINPLTKAFFEIITKKNRADVLLQVAAQVHKQYNTINNIQVAKLTSAVALNDAIRKEIIDIVKEISGKEKIQLIEEIDQDIIGGFVLTVDDRQIDGSIRSKLALLKRDLTSNQYVKEF